MLRTRPARVTQTEVIDTPCLNGLRRTPGRIAATPGQRSKLAGGLGFLRAGLLGS